MVEIISGAISTVLGIIDKVVPDREQADKMKIKVMEMQQNGDLKQLETRMSAIISEAESTDKWTSRARPSFLYVIYLMILASIPMGFLTAYDPILASQISTGMQQWLSSIPHDLWALFGVGYLGYSWQRSKDKQAILKGLG